MIRTVLLSGIAALTLLSGAGNAGAQDVGGLAIASGGMGMGPPPLLPRQPVFVSAARRGAPPGAMVTNPGVSRKSVHQQSIAKIRGDAGYLAGFNKGQPLALSRQPPVEPIIPNFTFIDAPFIVNNLNSTLSLTFGDGNFTGQNLPPDGGETVNTNGGEGGGQAPTPPENTGNRNGPGQNGPDEVDPVLSSFGPLPHLPFALANGGVRFNNVGTAVNVASGQGNVALQQITATQKKGRR